VNAEGWLQQGAPYRSVTREALPGSAAVWQTGTEFYDASTKRVYELPPLPRGHPRYTLTSTKDGSYTLRIATPQGPVDQTVTATEAQRTGADQISWSETWNGHKASLRPMVTPNTRLLHLHAAAGTTVDRNATAYFQHMTAPLFW
jgi:hypothetical protein